MMLFYELLCESIYSLTANLLRSCLAMLGIIIGVASVIIMIAIGQGGQLAVKRSIESLGSNLLVVAPTIKAGRPIKFDADLADIVEESPVVEAAAPVLDPLMMNVVQESNSIAASIIGTTPQFFQVREWTTTQGTLLRATDIENNPRIAVIGATVNEILFHDDSAIERTIRIEDVPFVVVGVLAKKGQSVDGQDQDNVVVIPFGIAKQRLMRNPDTSGIKMILVKIRSTIRLYSAAKQLENTLRKARNMEGDEDNYFTIRSLADISNSALKTGRTMTLLLGSVASISLIVGGIGIMNILYMCVTERTCEIGIRKTIGAREKDILLQFLLEAILLALIGCTIGVVVGLLGILIAKAYFGIAVASSLLGIGVAVVCAACIGLFFGYYPARKAAMLLPVEALRYS